MRYLTPLLLEDLKEKMVFLAGPRQVGKTYLAKRIYSDNLIAYYNWDNRQDKKAILAAHWPMNSRLIILDEIHKYRKWKTFIKGEYDKNHERLHFLVTGSAKMNIYRKGGDSLQGRYHHLRLHPFSVAEIVGRYHHDFIPFKELQFSKTHESESQEALKSLFHFTGFPEPFLKQSERFHRRWQNERIDRFFHEDVRELERILDLSGIEILSTLLPERVGSLLSLNSLREDLEVSHRAVKHWIEILDRLYFLFRITPYTAKQIHGLKKETKMYLWDWSLTLNEGQRFENLVASHLLKFCHYLQDHDGYRLELHHLRDVDKREVDFLVCCSGKPWFMVETKISDQDPVPALQYFGKRLNVAQRYHVVLHGRQDYMAENTRVMPAWKFLGALV